MQWYMFVQYGSHSYSQACDNIVNYSLQSLSIVIVVASDFICGIILA